MFLQYSQRSCLYECTMRHAIAKAGCLPWDYLVPDMKKNFNWTGSNDIRVCLLNKKSNEISLFNKAMDEWNVGGCDCLPDCESITYDVQVDKIPLPAPHLLCKDNVLQVHCNLGMH